MKKSTIRKNKSKTSLNTKNQIIKYGLNILYYIFGAKFSRNDRSIDFNTKKTNYFQYFQKII